MSVEGTYLGAERTGFIQVLQRMGGQVTVDAQGAEHGSVTSRTSALTGTLIRAEEIPSLDEVPILAGMGLTMTGPRPGGFDVLNGKTNEICAPGDVICAAPKEAFSPANLHNTISQLTGGGGQPVHAMYGTPDFWNLDGAPATVWTLNWAHGLIDNAPHPKHG